MCFSQRGTCFRVESPRIQSLRETKYESDMFSFTFWSFHRVSLGDIEIWENLRKTMQERVQFNKLAG